MKKNRKELEEKERLVREKEVKNQSIKIIKTKILQ